MLKWKIPITYTYLFHLKCYSLINYPSGYNNFRLFVQKMFVNVFIEMNHKVPNIYFLYWHYEFLQSVDMPQTPACLPWTLSTILSRRHSKNGKQPSNTHINISRQRYVEYIFSIPSSHPQFYKISMSKSQRSMNLSFLC